KGRIKAGQVWRLSDDLSAKATESFTMRLTNEPGDDDGVIVAVQEVTEGGRTWRVDAIPFLKNAQISVTTDALATARFVAYSPYFACGNDFCAQQSEAADAAC